MPPFDPLMASDSLIALGSNIGDKIGTIRNAVAAVARLPGTRITACSAIYRTPPWGMTEQDWFANAVIRVATMLPPMDLLESCLAIEAAMGRIRRVRWGPRVIDLDLLSHGSSQIDSPRLVLPHPRIAERAFVLIPLRDVAPDFQLNGQSIEAMLRDLDSSGIQPISKIQ